VKKFKENLVDKLSGPKVAATKVATMDQYRFISIERDTTYLDTSPTKEYIALIICEKIILTIGFSNEGQTYNTL
jgi:hypothetical protein